MTEPAFESMVPGLPADEDAAAAQLRADLLAEGSTIANLSPFSAFFRLMKAIFVKPVLYIRDLIVSFILPNLFTQTATLSPLDIHAAGMDDARKGASKAAGNLTFYRSGTSGALGIAAGVVVQSPEIDGVVYRLTTTETGTILDGNSSALVPVEAEAEGAAYNLGDGYYSILPGPVAGIIAVANEAGWLIVPGQDIESDDSLRERLRLKWRRLSGWHTGDTYRSLISDVAAIDPDDVYFDLSAPRGPGSADAYILTESGPPPQAVVDAANTHINTDGNHGLGDDLLVFAMPLLPAAIEILITAPAGSPTADQTALALDATDLIRAAFRELPGAYLAVPRVAPFERVSRSALAGEIHEEFALAEAVDWISPVADLEPLMELPAIHRVTLDAALQVLLDAGPAVDKGGGLVGLPATAHGFVAGGGIVIAGTAAYDAAYILDASTSVNELVVLAAFAAEAFTGAETATEPVIDEGGGKVGLRSTAHGFATGTRIVLDTTINFDGIHTVDAASTTDKIVITAAYVAETLAGTETAEALIVEVAL